MVAEPYGADAWSRSTTRRTRPTRNSKAISILALLVLGALSVPVVFREEGEHCKIRGPERTIQKFQGIELKTDESWKQKEPISGQAQDVEVPRFKRWKLQEIQVNSRRRKRRLGERRERKPVFVKLDWRKMAEAAFASIQETLQRLVNVQRSQQWGKHLKSPENFKPSNRDEEIKQWQDWKFSFLNYLSAIDTQIYGLLQEVSKD